MLQWVCISNYHCIDSMHWIRIDLEQHEHKWNFPHQQLTAFCVWCHVETTYQSITWVIAAVVTLQYVLTIIPLALQNWFKLIMRLVCEPNISVIIGKSNDTFLFALFYTYFIVVFFWFVSYLLVGWLNFN